MGSRVKLGMGLLALVAMGCPCGCAETGTTCVWSTVWSTLLAFLQQIGQTGT